MNCLDFLKKDSKLKFLKDKKNIINYILEDDFFKSKNSFDKEYIKSLLLHYPDNFYLQWKNEQMEDVKIRIKHKLSIDLQTFKINMENKELIINVPEGYEIDKENSTFECIKFKKKEIKPWRYSHEVTSGYNLIGTKISDLSDDLGGKALYITKKQAKSALAMAQISQIMSNDERFGGPITDEEWGNVKVNKYIIHRSGKSTITKTFINSSYSFLAFHTEKQRNSFLEENEDLVKDYLMID